MLRFWNHEIDRNLEGVLTVIDDASRNPHPASLRSATLPLRGSDFKPCEENTLSDFNRLFGMTTKPSEHRLHIGSRPLRSQRDSTLDGLNWGGSRRCCQVPRDGTRSSMVAADGHNGLVGGSSPPGPTTQFAGCGEFL